MKMEPLHDNIFIERDKPEERMSPGGVHLPSQGDAPDTATVIAVGPGRILADGTKVIPEVKPGDRILLGRFSGTDVQWGVDRRTVVPWDQVLGRVTEDAE